MNTKIRNNERKVEMTEGRIKEKKIKINKK